MLIFSFLSAILLHECGHMTALALFGARITNFRFSPFGITLSHTKLASPLQDLLVASLGPLFGIVGYIVAHYSNSFPTFSLISLYLSLFNLLPIKTLDGSRMANALLVCFLSPHLAEESSRLLSRITLLLFWLVGIYLFLFLDGSPSLFLMALTLFFQGVKEEARVNFL